MFVEKRYRCYGLNYLLVQMRVANKCFSGFCWLSLSCIYQHPSTSFELRKSMQTSIKYFHYFDNYILFDDRYFVFCWNNRKRQKENTGSLVILNIINLIIWLIKLSSYCYKLRIMKNMYINIIDLRIRNGTQNL